MQRKLTAILSADVVGYSGLMEADEAGTLAKLKANRGGIFDPLVSQHGGRQFKLMGDGALVEFSSVVAAVKCALAIQAQTEAAKTGIRHRIGINLGEVIVEGDDIYGEGVNIAARLQGLAAAGGVAVSRMVRDNAEGKMNCVFEDLGEHNVKNIDRPLHVFAVRAAGESAESARVDDRSKLSVCVLPFANMSGEAEQEYFSDGISEDIITDLSKVSALGVIARNTAFQFKGRSVDVPQVARQLRVSHVLEGSVRKAGGRVRITAQLIDGASGEHVWADRYDRDLNDIFALQDEISQAIVGALKLKLLPEEKRAIEQRGTTSPEAYKFYLMARQYRDTGNAGNRRAADLAIRLCRRAVEIDPNYARAWALLALVLSNTKLYFDVGVEDGLKEAEQALALDPGLAEAHAAKARVLNMSARYPEARIEVESALALDPDSYEANREAAMYAAATNDRAAAIKYFERAADLNENEYYAAGMAVGFCQAEGDEAGKRRAAQRALARVERLLASEPDHGSALSFGITALMALGEVERGKEWIERALLLDPDNVNMRYNLACSLITQVGAFDEGLDVLATIIERVHQGPINWMKIDPDMGPVREHPRFKAMVAAAEARLAAEDSGAP
ncbi:MAG: adenylate/guanylate cyclase domain-containing protein [Proteobacteria bacterium]|nr:adenylate/guanylate cyclase domain-containing protein [Pseudomonadota bacterium]